MFRRTTRSLAWAAQRRLCQGISSVPPQEQESFWAAPGAQLVESFLTSADSEQTRCELFSVGGVTVLFARATHTKVSCLPSILRQV